MLLVGQHGGVGGLAGLQVRRIVVGRPGVLLRGGEGLTAVEQRIAEQEVDLGDALVLRIDLDDALVPARRGQELRLVLGRILLRQRVIVLGQVFHVRTQFGQHFLGGRPAAPERRRRIIGRRVALLLAYHQIAEAALGIGADHAGLEGRRARGGRVALDEGGIGVGGVGIALLLQEGFAQRGIDQRIEARIAVLRKVVVERLPATELHQRQGDHAQRVLRHVVLALVHAGQGLVGLVLLAGRQVTVEDRDEGADGFLELGLLVLRPAVLVLRRHEERRLVGQVHDDLVFGLGLRVALGQEQQFGAAEVRVADQIGIRMALGQPPQRVDRGIDLADVLVGARELVEHAVVVLVLGPVVQQLVVETDRVLDRLLALLGIALGIAHLDLQVREATGGLGLGIHIGLQFQQLAIIVGGALRIGGDRLGGDDRQLFLRRLLHLADRLADAWRGVLRLRGAGTQHQRDGAQRKGQFTGCHSTPPSARDRTGEPVQSVPRSGTCRSASSGLRVP